MRLHVCFALTAVLLLSHSLTPVWAAERVDLQGQSPSVLRSLTGSTSVLQPVRSEVDFTHLSHVHFQQIYRGYPVWGADAVMHVPNATIDDAATLLSRGILRPPQGATLSGRVYRQLDADLQRAPTWIFNFAQTEKAFLHALQLHQQQAGQHAPVTGRQSRLMVYVDAKQRAHWAFQISFFTKNAAGVPQKPAYILEAESFAVLKTWNDLKTLDPASGGGYGGNQKIGKTWLDGSTGHLPALALRRDSLTQQCYLQNDEVTVQDMRSGKAVMHFPCAKPSPAHHNLYWSGAFDTVNGAYSPGNDALHLGKAIKDLYQQWYGIPVLTQDDKPMMLNMVVHENMENAYWDGSEMVFGDGGDTFYPLVSIGVAAHEISHGFTEQHANLEYYGQSGGINEAFSDMAAQAAEFFVTGHNSWQIGPELMKQDGALRYMDDPTRDCTDDAYPGECSISHVKDYSSELDVHFSSGVYNKLFYLMSHAPDWDIRKAFDVMVFANAHYWTSESDFGTAACGIVAAAKQYGYAIDPLLNAMSRVGISVTRC